MYKACICVFVALCVTRLVLCVSHLTTCVTLLAKYVTGSACSNAFSHASKVFMYIYVSPLAMYSILCIVFLCLCSDYEELIHQLSLTFL